MSDKPSFAAAIEVRHYQPADAPAVARLYGGRPYDGSGRNLQDVAGTGGVAWVALYHNSLIGCASAVPVPGLPEIMDLQGYVAPTLRRRGVGSRLLQTVLPELRERGGRQAAHGVADLESAAAYFLRHHQFFLEHEEWQMELDSFAGLPLGPLPPGCSLETLPRWQAIRHFRHLYDSSFRGTPWYQPYLTDAEVSTELERAEDILFLRCDGRLAGFVWMRQQRPATGQVEPIGIVPAYQGRGAGRALLLAALRTFAHRGVTHVRLGVWRENRRAIRLYESLGFRRTGSIYYLARDL